MSAEKTQASDFVREDRYIVIKRDHLRCYHDDNLNEAREQNLRAFLEEREIDTIDCVVVEADWPEYEPVWAMIEDRVTNPTWCVREQQALSGPNYWVVRLPNKKWWAAPHGTSEQDAVALAREWWEKAASQ